MQSFHHSRGRILFEVFCALGISASCVGAWMQTGASALLAAAAVAGLYGLVHLFDMRGRKPTVLADLQPIESAADEETTVPALQEAPVAPPPVELQLTAETAIEQVERAEPTAPKASRTRKPKAAPKTSRRRASAREEAKVVEIAPPEEANVTEMAPPDEPRVVELTPAEEPRVIELIPPEESKIVEPGRFEDAQAPAPPTPEQSAPVPLTPLFDPKPFVRQQRTAFGRKG